MPRHVAKVQLWIQTDPASAGSMSRYEGLQDLNFNDPGAAEVDATGLDDDNSVTLPGIPQAATVSPTLFLDPASSSQWSTLDTMRTDQVPRPMQLRMIGTGKMFTFSGTLTRRSPGFGRGNALTVATEFKLTTGLTLVNLPT